MSRTAALRLPPSPRQTPTVIDERFSQAVVAYIGRVPALEVVDRDQSVAALWIGARNLIPRIRAMIDELYAANLQKVSAGDHLTYMAEITRRAEVWLRSHHPELSAEAVAAVRNQFAYDWR